MCVWIQDASPKAEKFPALASIPGAPNLWPAGHMRVVWPLGVARGALIELKIRCDPPRKTRAIPAAHTT